MVAAAASKESVMGGMLMVRRGDVQALCRLIGFMGTLNNGSGGSAVQRLKIEA
jgi:hypothetical protein